MFHNVWPETYISNGQAKFKITCAGKVYLFDDALEFQSTLNALLRLADSTNSEIEKIIAESQADKEGEEDIPF